MKKLNRILIVLLIVSIILFGGIIAIIYKTNNNDGKQVSEEAAVEEAAEETVVVPDSFVSGIDNTIQVPGEIVDLIVNYNNDYYNSIYNLELVSTANYFLYAVDGAISDNAIKLMVETRKLYDFDFSLTKAEYDIEFTDYYYDGEDYYVYFLVDDRMDFAFLNGITSETYGIENCMILRKVNDELKIVDYDKTQGYYIMFYDSYETVEDVDSVYKYYYNLISNSIEEDAYLKTQAETSEYVCDKSYDVAYDRDAAVAYANTYYHSRNHKWYDFSDEGGNCQNYASQCLFAGGMIMDYTGSLQWKFYCDDGDYDPGLNEYDEKYGRSASWVSVPYFNNYCEENDASGLVCDCEANTYYAQKGDIIQVGISSLTHTTIVSDVVDGHILLNSNSIDMKNWPLEAYTYPTKQLIKILGCNY